MYIDFPQYTGTVPDMTAGEAQTRSEETGLVQHKTLKEAILAAIDDKTIWKVSYQTKEGWKRFILR